MKRCKIYYLQNRSLKGTGHFRGSPALPCLSIRKWLWEFRPLFWDHYLEGPGSMLDRTLVRLVLMLLPLEARFTCKKKGFSFIQAAKLAESEGTLRASGMRPGSNPEPRAPKRVRWSLRYSPRWFACTCSDDPCTWEPWSDHYLLSNSPSQAGTCPVWWHSHYGSIIWLQRFDIRGWFAQDGNQDIDHQCTAWWFRDVELVSACIAVMHSKILVDSFNSSWSVLFVLPSFLIRHVSPAYKRPEFHAHGVISIISEAPCIWVLLQFCALFAVLNRNSLTVISVLSKVII